MKQVLLTVAVCFLGLSACVQNPTREFGALKPTDTGFEATLGVNDNLTPVNGRNSEMGRLEALQEWTTDAGICPNGYEIVDRTVSQRLGYEYWIKYTGKCL